MTEHLEVARQREKDRPIGEYEKLCANKYEN